MGRMTYSPAMRRLAYREVAASTSTVTTTPAGEHNKIGSWYLARRNWETLMPESFLNWLIGKKIKSVVLNQEKDQIEFVCEEGNRLFGVDGDCCSQTWIEHLEMPENIEGATIQSVDEPEIPSWDNHKCRRGDYRRTEEENKEAGCCDHDVLQVYHTRFRTDKGDIVLEYRNDSNGYYGGSLTDLTQ